MRIGLLNLLRVAVAATVAMSSIFLVGANQVDAAIVTYDFTGNNPYGLGTGDIGKNTATVMQDGLTMVITGEDRKGPNDRLHINSNNGLGVDGAKDRNRVGADESLFFDFTPQEVIALDSLLFERGSQAGALDVYVDDVFVERVSWSGEGNSHFSADFQSSLEARTGKIYEFRGVADGFRVVSLTVETVSGPQALRSVQSVPEPTTVAIWSMLGGIGLVVGRRRRAAA